MTANIFISFASKDVKMAMTLCTALENRGFSCWISARDIQPGENFQIAIVKAIRRAKIMLLVFTGNSNNSEEVTKELALASQQKMIVIPLRVEDVAPNDAFAYEFATRQWIDAFADWEFAIEQLTRRIGTALLERSAGMETHDAADAINTLISSGAADLDNVTLEEPPAAAAETVAPAPKVEAPPPPPEPEVAPAPIEAPAVEPAPIKATAPVEPPKPTRDEPARSVTTAGGTSDKTKMFAVIGFVVVVLVGLGLAAPSILKALQPSDAPAPAPVATEPTVVPAVAPPTNAPAAQAPTAAAASATAPAVNAPSVNAPVKPKKAATTQIRPKDDIPF